MKKLLNFALKLLNYKLLNLSLYNKIIIVENLKKKIYKFLFLKVQINIYQMNIKDIFGI